MKKNRGLADKIPQPSSSSQIAKTVLDNGIKIVTETMSAFRAVAIGITVGAGSATENAAESGLSHFIEHMTFKGTPRRNPFQIATELDQVAGKINAFTSKEYTCYYVIILDTHHDVALSVLSDIFLNSLYNPSDIELERGVVLEEVKMYEDTPDEKIHDVFTSTLLHHHPLGSPILGNEETIKTFDRNKLLAYRDKLYTPDNIVIAVAGDISHEKIVKEMRALFGGLSGRRQRRPHQKPSTQHKIVVLNKKTEQVHLCLGCPGPAMNDPRRYPLVVLDNVLGGNMSSHLFQEVREKRGLAYSVFSTLSPYMDTGTFYAYAGCAKENAGDIINIILEEFAAFKKNGVTKEELERSKEYIKGTLVLGMESTASRMNWMARSEYYHDRVVSVDETFAEIDKVTNESIIEVANQYFTEDQLTLAMIGDITDAPVKKLSC